MNPPSDDYAAALRYLYGRTTGRFRLGLERTASLLREFGEPHRTLPVFHIAGTNGKGSAVASVAALLRSRGFRVGTYTSPHLVDFRERIEIDGHPIPEDEVTLFVTTHRPLIERIGASFFEVSTVLALDWFVRAGASAVVLETGLGGRLDSTNVVDPVAAGVTSIGYDHAEYLGYTLEEIAREKAGIFKAGRPAVIGESARLPLKTLVACARSRGASDIRVVGKEMIASELAVTAGGTSFVVEMGAERASWCTPLLGRHQAANAMFAWLLLDAAGEPFRVALEAAAESLRTVHVPGRFQRSGKFIFDVAHNPSGAAVLAETLRMVRPARPVVAVFCALKEKDWRQMIDTLGGVVDEFVFTSAPSAPVGREWDLEEVGRWARECGTEGTTVSSLSSALAIAGARGATVLVTGSFHTVGDAMSLLQLSPWAR